MSFQTNLRNLKYIVDSAHLLLNDMKGIVLLFIKERYMLLKKENEEKLKSLLNWSSPFSDGIARKKYSDNEKYKKFGAEFRYLVVQIPLC